MAEDNMTVLKAKAVGATRSKTMWFNGLAGLFIQFLPEAAQALPALYGLMPDNIYSVLLIVLVGGNMFLRFMTKKDLANK